MENIIFPDSWVNWVFAAVIVILGGIALWKSYPKNGKTSRIWKYIAVMLSILGFGCLIALMCCCIKPLEHTFGISIACVIILVFGVYLVFVATEDIAEFLLGFGIVLAIIGVVAIVVYICTIEPLTWSKALLRVLLFAGSLCFPLGVYMKSLEGK